MALGPILSGRLPGSLNASRIMQHLQQQNGLLQRLQDQVATGQRYFLPSEAPASALRSISLQRTIERTAQHQLNITTNRSLLLASDASLTSVADALNQAKGYALAGIGSTASNQEKEILANEVASLIQQVVNAANTKFQGRYLFGGSQTDRPPFELLGDGIVRYNGDAHQIQSWVDTNLLVGNNVSGVTAFGAITEPVTADIDPALTPGTRVEDLLGGRGVTLGQVQITLNDGANESAIVDLGGAQTINDIKTRLEAAFPVSGGSLTLTVEIDPASNNGLRLVSSSGTVAVANVNGSNVATDLGIASAASAVINGGDLDPKLTNFTPISALNNGAGIGTTAGNTLLVTKGSTTHTIDVSSATNVGQLLNIFRQTDSDLIAEINSAGNGLAISSRLSGAPFAIGENGDTIAADLGIRTFTGNTLLADLNRGIGVPNQIVGTNGNLDPALIQITRRNGTDVEIDIAGLKTVQQVLDAINAIAPGELVASLNSVGNGITIVDDDGVSVGDLVVAGNQVAAALGIDGSETSGVAANGIAGREVNPREANGVINLLVSLENALRNRDDVSLNRLIEKFTGELDRFTLVRGNIGSQLKVLDEIDSRLIDQEVLLKETLSLEFDADLTQVITQIAYQQATLQATLQVAASSLQLSLFNYL